MEINRLINRQSALLNTSWTSMPLLNSTSAPPVRSTWAVPTDTSGVSAEASSRDDGVRDLQLQNLMASLGEVYKNESQEEKSSDAAGLDTAASNVSNAGVTVGDAAKEFASKGGLKSASSKMSGLAGHVATPLNTLAAAETLTGNDSDLLDKTSAAVKLGHEGAAAAKFLGTGATVAQQASEGVTSLAAKGGDEVAELSKYSKVAALQTGIASNLPKTAATLAKAGKAVPVLGSAASVLSGGNDIRKVITGEETDKTKALSGGLMVASGVAAASGVGAPVAAGLLVAGLAVENRELLGKGAKAGFSAIKNSNSGTVQAGKFVVKSYAEAGQAVAHTAADTGKAVAHKAADTGKAVASTAVQAADTGKAVAHKALDTGKAVTHTATDAGKAVTHKAADTGKAVADTATDAGKSVVKSAGDTLKSIL